MYYIHYKFLAHCALQVPDTPASTVQESLDHNPDPISKLLDMICPYLTESHPTHSLNRDIEKRVLEAIQHQLTRSKDLPPSVAQVMQDSVRGYLEDESVKNILVSFTALLPLHADLKNNHTFEKFAIFFINKASEDTSKSLFGLSVPFMTSCLEKKSTSQIDTFGRRLSPATVNALLHNSLHDSQFVMLLKLANNSSYTNSVVLRQPLDLVLRLDDIKISKNGPSILCHLMAKCLSLNVFTAGINSIEKLLSQLIDSDQKDTALSLLTTVTMLLKGSKYSKSSNYKARSMTKVLDALIFSQKLTETEVAPTRKRIEGLVNNGATARLASVALEESETPPSHRPISEATTTSEIPGPLPALIPLPQTFQVNPNLPLPVPFGPFAPFPFQMGWPQFPFQMGLDPRLAGPFPLPFPFLPVAPQPMPLPFGQQPWLPVIPGPEKETPPGSLAFGPPTGGG